MRVASKKLKTRVSRGDIFVNKESKELVRVMSASKEHTCFGCLAGKITA